MVGACRQHSESSTFRLCLSCNHNAPSERGLLMASCQCPTSSWGGLATTKFSQSRRGKRKKTKVNLDYEDVGGGGNTGVRPGSPATDRSVGSLLWPAAAPQRSHFLRDPGGTHGHFLSSLPRPGREAEPSPYAGSRLLPVSSRLALPGTHTAARAELA